MARIFISYARKDGAAVAEELADRLRAFEHDVFLDVHSIRAGTHWRAEIQQRIRWAEVMIVLVTPASNESEYVRQEIALAERVGKAVIPLQVGGTALPEQLRRKWQALKLDNENYDRVLLEMEHAIKRLPRPSRFPLVALIGIGLIAILGIVVLTSGILRNGSLQAANSTPTAEGVVYTEDFEDGVSDGWKINWGNEFTVADDGTGNRVWRSAADGQMFFEPSLDWRDYAIQMRYYVANWDTTHDNPGFLLAIRRMADRDCSRYGFYFPPQNIVVDATDENCDTIKLFNADNYPNTPGQWHDFYVEARGTEIQWRLDNGQVYRVSDNTYSAGSLAILNLSSSEFWFDDIRITSFGD